MRIKATDWVASYVTLVTLNGREVTSITVEADTNEGWVDVLVLDPNGKPIIDYEKRDMVTVRLYGRVKMSVQLWKCDRCDKYFKNASEWAKHRLVPHIGGLN